MTNVIVGNVPELGVLPRYGFGGATARPVQAQTEITLILRSTYITCRAIRDN